jgi:glycosidase
MSWYENGVMYQIYPLGLTGAPWRNDGSDEGAVEVGSHANSSHRLLNIVDDGWISHMQRLSVSSLMLNPVFESDAHGYDTRDYTQVDRRLGTSEDLRRLVDSCHAANIKVILDAVFNHVGRGFWAFKDVLKNKQVSPYAGWFDIEWGSDNQYADGFAYECWSGVPYLVKLNHKNLELNEYLAKVVRAWETDFDIDGIRLDVAYCLDLGFLGYLRKIADELSAKRGEKFLLLGETMFGDYRRWMNEHACDSVYNYEAYKGLWSSMNSTNMHEIAYTLNRQFGSEPWDLYTGQHLLSFVDNHDVTRIATQLSDQRLLWPLYGLLFGMPGVPCLYYGSEWGVEGKKSFGDHEIRPAFGSPQYNELSKQIASLAYARTSSEAALALCEGDYQELACQPSELVFQRQTGDRRVIVAINAAPQPVRLDFNAGCGRAIDVISGEEHDFGGGSQVEPFSCHYWLCES